MQSQQYEICVQEQLDTDGNVWFDGFEISHDKHGRSILIGTIIDQAALYGLLNKIRNLGLTLLSINPISS